MLLAILLAEALSPAVSRMLEYQVSIFKAITPANVLLVLGFIVVLGVLSGIVPALLIQKAQPIEIVRGTLRLKTKTVYSKRPYNGSSDPALGYGRPGLQY